MSRPRLALACLAVAALLAACGAPRPTATFVLPPAASPSAASSTSPTPSPSSSSPSDATTAPITPVPGADAGLAARILATLRAERDDLALDLMADTVAGAAQLDGTVDDGAGPGRLLVVVSPPGATNPGDLCLDREFAQGGACARVRLGDGSVLYRRGLVGASNGVQTVVVYLEREDGSGVLLEAGNFRIEPPPVLVAGQPRPTPEITRDGPVLTLDDLDALARSVASATNGCSAIACPP